MYISKKERVLFWLQLGHTPFRELKRTCTVLCAIILDLLLVLEVDAKIKHIMSEGLLAGSIARRYFAMRFVRFIETDRMTVDQDAPLQDVLQQHGLWRVGYAGNKMDIPIAQGDSAGIQKHRTRIYFCDASSSQWGWVALNAMERDGFRPATLRELAVFSGVILPKLPCEEVVAAGSYCQGSACPSIAYLTQHCLDKTETPQQIYLYWRAINFPLGNCTFASSCGFLAVQKIHS